MENLINQIAVKSINLIGVCGIILIFYGIVSSVKNSKWELLEKYADYLATFGTLLGALLTAISIYLPSNLREPEEFSKFISAPLVILSVLIACIFIIIRRRNLPVHIVNGFALLAISGALFRLLSY